jgi:hypothetical protein
MPLVIAVWPNNTISAVWMQLGFSMVDLYNEIDMEACPLDATCYLATRTRDGLYVTLDWERLEDDEASVTPESNGIRVDSLTGKLRKLEWPFDIQRRWLRHLDRHGRRDKLRSAPRRLSANELQHFPSEPTETFSVDEVRGMPSFCGVYFAFNDDGSCHYVGESLDVTKRVSKSRPEIGERRIGLIRCDSNERRRIEAYFVATLDPAGNKSSTHAMRIKEGTDGTQAG